MVDLNNFRSKNFTRLIVVWKNSIEKRAEYVSCRFVHHIRL